MEHQEYSKLYNAYYYAHDCGRPYVRDEEWLRFFDTIAEHIVNDIQPTTVLDAGCAMGFLVESLRQRGVEAFGMDVSEYAIQNVHPDIKPYCWVGSITEPFPQRYDLIVSIEVLEHMPADEAEQAIANFCKYTDDILFSSTPFDYKEVTHINVRLPEYWGAEFARYGFFRDVDFDASFITPWAARFRRRHEPLDRIVREYERLFWALWKENVDLRDSLISERCQLNNIEEYVEALNAYIKQQDDTYKQQYKTYKHQERVYQALLDQKDAELIENQRTLRLVTSQKEYFETRWLHLEDSMGWQILSKLQQLRAMLAPPASVRDQCLTLLFRAFREKRVSLLGDAIKISYSDISQKVKAWLRNMRLRILPSRLGRKIEAKEVASRDPVQLHRSTIDIIICIHNALDDVKRCLNALLTHTSSPYRLILVDDGSNLQTYNYLVEFSRENKCVLLRNEESKGYTIAANYGLHRVSSDYLVLLNSDTIVTEGWLDRLVDCCNSDSQIGLVGPLSNAASWQSIPITEENGDWAINPLPEDLTVDEMGKLVARYSDRIYPFMPFLNGFCLLIRRDVLRDIGYFDEDNFGSGYGEENDYALRARDAGWRLALADNAYVYHAHSRSYSAEVRRKLSAKADLILVEKHGSLILGEGVEFCRESKVMQGIRDRARVMFARQEYVEKGNAEFMGRKVLFILPSSIPTGGGHVIIDEAMAMREMGVDAQIFNLSMYKSGFEHAYPDIEVPVRYGNRKDLVDLAYDFDAVVATTNTSVAWMSNILRFQGKPVLGYYIQDFEPYLYPKDSVSYQIAWNSYTLIPDLVRFTKTAWNRQEVRKCTGADSIVVEPSLNIDLFRPRPRADLREWPERPLRIAAMIRPSTPRRSPKLTMKLLREAYRRYGGKIEIIIFGTELDDVDFADLPRDFAWSLVGVLNRKQVAWLLNGVDIFLDFSVYQAMGLTALEAMASGVAVTVPKKGGALSFAQHEQNCLVVDTSSSDDCFKATCRLIEDHDLRLELQKNAIQDACNFFTERVAFNILKALFYRDGHNEV